MSAPLHNTHSITCPICDRTDRRSPDRPLDGLYTCPTCQTRLIVCESRHYVRDPVTAVPVDAQQVRRRSRPLARLLRDAGTLKWMATASAIALGATLISFSGRQRLETNPAPPASESDPTIEMIRPLD